MTDIESALRWLADHGARMEFLKHPLGQKWDTSDAIPALRVVVRRDGPCGEKLCGMARTDGALSLEPAVVEMVGKLKDLWDTPTELNHVDHLMGCPVVVSEAVPAPKATLTFREFT